MKRLRASRIVVVCALSAPTLVAPGPSAALAQHSAAVDLISSFRFDAAVEAATHLPRLHSLLVNWNGEIVLERYFSGKDASSLANVKSVSKSVVSALVGIAIDQGHIAGVDQPIGDYFGDRLSRQTDAPKRMITIENLLTMQSGLETTSNRNYGAWVTSPNWIDFVLHQPIEVPPGNRMVYSTGNTHLLSAIVTAATGKSTLQFAREALGEPLDFHLAAWPRDPQGIYFGGNDMELTPRQMVAFGELYLRRGRANGRQVIPSGWVDASLQPRAESTRERGRYYGYGWWIREMAGFETPYAWGYGGQFIILVPALDLVVVMTSESTPSSERRAHRRSMYNLVEHLIVTPVSAALRRRQALAARQ